VQLPMALADLHHALAPGAPYDLQLLHGECGEADLLYDDPGGRSSASWQHDNLADLLIGAGLPPDHVDADSDVARARGVRARTLPDTVSPGMRLLICGLNPSLYAADAGVGFARPGNRFWPAAIAAGLVDPAHDRDPATALRQHAIGMTDLVKRTTVASAELTKDEYRNGAARVERLIEWLQPGAVCFVGLEGWRAAIDAKAAAGVQPRALGGRPVYVMGSTSGLNARTSITAHAEHLRAALELARANANPGAEEVLRRR